MKCKLESGLPGERSITSDAQMATPLSKELKQRTMEPLDENERGE